MRRSTSRLTRWVGERARKPSGWLGRFFYSLPLPRTYFRILDELRLGEEDVLLEIGPGGGVFTGVALERAGRAAAIDHSPDMVDATRKHNARAVAEGRLEVVLGDAAKLPWPDGSFTVAVMNQVLFWLPDPEPVFREIHRVLRPGGRLAILSAEDRPLLRVVMAPYIRSGAQLHSDREVDALLVGAGFGPVAVHSSRFGLQLAFATRAAGH